MNANSTNEIRRMIFSIKDDKNINIADCTNFRLLKIYGLNF